MIKVIIIEKRVLDHQFENDVVQEESQLPALFLTIKDNCIKILFVNQDMRELEQILFAFLYTYVL